MSNATPRSVGIKWGLYLGAASALFGIIITVAKLYTNQAISFVAILISIVGVVLALREYKASNGGFMSLGQGFQTGLAASVIAGIISSVVSALHYMIVPDLKDEVLNVTIAELEKNPQMTQDIIDQTVKISETMMQPFVSIPVGILGSLLMGALISVIVAAIMKKDGAPAAGIEDIGN
ncbi:MAG: DUF4199 domain-containing protein [Bacteroidetes bacterium]|nr:MAG: DUF4199 domain-containing protein [Bacteroidota bacterium]